MALPPEQQRKRQAVQIASKNPEPGGDIQVGETVKVVPTTRPPEGRNDETAKGLMTDQDLLTAYLESRDGDSLGAFLRRYQESLTRFSTRFLGDADAAQDVVQETFLRVAREPKRLLGVRSCHNWLLTVARNIGISHLRKRARIRKHTLALADRVAAGGDGTQGGALEALEAEETRARVKAEIERLDPRLREVLLLKVQEEKSYREIAEITGLSVTYVGYILHHAVKQLSRRLNRTREN